jgi:Mg/Co/Ni transporter MgtE
MGVNVGAVPVGAFIALVLAAVLVIATIAARRRGHIHDRHVLVVIAAIIFVLIIYGMGFGVMQPW